MACHDTVLDYTDPSMILKLSLLIFSACDIKNIFCAYYFNESFNDFHNPFKNYMRGSIVNTRNLLCRVVDVCVIFIPCRSKHGPKMQAGLCGSSWQDSKHGTALMFMSYQHSLKYLVPCHTLSCAKRPCYYPLQNGMVKFQL